MGLNKKYFGKILPVGLSLLNFVLKLTRFLCCCLPKTCPASPPLKKKVDEVSDSPRSLESVMMCHNSEKKKRVS